MPRNKASLSRPRIIVRDPGSIFQIQGKIVNGTFHGRWHFSFGENYDPKHMQFGTLRVFNDDTLSPGAVWPLHPHHDIEVVTYCAEGEFRHADQGGEGGILRKGWVQHTTVGSGMWHSEINNRSDASMRFIQMWFIPSEGGLPPSLEQKAVEKKERTNILLPLVSNEHDDALPIRSDARVYSCFLEKRNSVKHSLKENRGAYVYVLEGDAVEVNGHKIPALGAAQAEGAMDVLITANGNSELLLIDVLLRGRFASE
jgi:redox-sensitive bicupin YhaK (pirin superfamily)